MARVGRGGDGGMVAAGTEDDSALGMRALLRGWARALVLSGDFASETGAPVVVGGAASHGAAGDTAPSW